MQWNYKQRWSWINTKNKVKEAEIKNDNKIDESNVSFSPITWWFSFADHTKSIIFLLFRLRFIH